MVNQLVPLVTRTGKEDRAQADCHPKPSDELLNGTVLNRLL